MYIMYSVPTLLCLLLLAVHHPASGQGPGERCKALSGYMTVRPNCLVLGYCHEVECNFDGPIEHGALSVHSCEDPVQVVLRVVAESFDQSYTLSVAGEQSYCEVDLPMDGRLYATYSRNVSHLQFRAHAIIEGDIAVEVIPAIEIPLNLANCTCDDLEDATENFQFPIPGVTHQCSVDDTTCLGFLCHISFQDTQLDSDAVVDPCSESIAVTVRDSSGVQVFRQVFSESSAIQFEVESFSPTVYVLISHYTYSMRVSVLMDTHIFGGNITLLPEEPIVLDRSSCSSLGNFPASPLPSGTTNGQCSSETPSAQTSLPSGSTTLLTAETPSTNSTGSSSKSSSLAIAVSVPLILLTVTVCIALIVCLGFFYARKKREVRFRRVAFQKMEEEDEDMT